MTVVLLEDRWMGLSIKLPTRPEIINLMKGGQLLETVWVWSEWVMWPRGGISWDGMVIRKDFSPL